MMRRVYLEVDPPTLGQAMYRIVRELSRRAPPWVQLVKNPQEADILVWHVCGLGNTPPELTRPEPAPWDFVMVQYNFLITGVPVADWVPLWKRAKMVWSYYDMRPLAAEHGFNFYHSALGVDGKVFHPHGGRKKYVVGTSGYVAETESVGECTRAAQRVGGRVFHLGPDLGLGHHIQYGQGIYPDQLLAASWAACHYVSGLRRLEGFELPAVEALACGSRPVLFDIPCYTQWYGDLAEYVPEVAPAEVEEALVELFQSRRRAVVTEAERAEAVRRFDWVTIAGGFWERLEAAVR